MAFKAKHQVFHKNEWHTITPLNIKPVDLNEVQPVSGSIYFWVSDIESGPVPCAVAPSTPVDHNAPRPVMGLTSILRNSKNYRVVSVTKAIVSKASGKVSELLDDSQPVPAPNVLAEQGLVLVEMRIL